MHEEEMCIRKSLFDDIRVHFKHNGYSRDK